MEHPQCIDPGIVTIAPDDMVSVASNRREVGDPDPGKLRRLQIEALRGVVALAHRTGAGRPQGVERMAGFGAVIPTDQQHALLLNQFK